jgi:leader peptidase (prepilin peptidase)/N-methyltransferase
VFLGILAAALGGLLVGSLLNVVALRLPAGESLRRPRVRCTHCKRAPRLRQSIPVVTWLREHGGCPNCGEPIARRYVVVEALTGALFAAVVIARHGDAADVWLGLALVTFLIPLALIDFDTRTLPNKLTLPAAIVAILLGTWLDPGGETERLLAGVLAGGFFLVVALAFPTGMGIGDVKLAAVLGLFLGREVAAALLVALVAGVLVGAVIVRRKGVAEGRRTAVPFGPFLALGGAAALLFGEAMVDWYLGSF